MSEDVRPFEEYKEMIKDMRKEEMIKGLYDLSARITEQDKEIERLQSIIKEVREYIENNSLYYQEEEYDYEDNLVLGEPDDSDAKKELLEILDKESDKE